MHRRSKRKASAFTAAAAGAAAAVLAAAPLPSSAAGSVDVDFIAPDDYTDAGRTALDRERTTHALADRLHQLGRALPDGQTLHVDVLDVDLAGRIEPHGSHDLRIVRGGADWPRLKLRYALSADGHLLRSGEETIADLSYTSTLPLPSTNSVLPYEERLLTRWFTQRFAPASAGRTGPTVDSISEVNPKK